MHQVTSAHQLAGCQQLPALPSRAQLHRWSCLARFKRTDLEDIVQQAQEPPQITHPVLLPVSSQAPPAVPQQQQQASPAHPKQHAAYSTVLPQQRQQQQLDDLVISKLRPSRMDFAAMYAQLAAWQQRFLSAHVPRHCFDAPELGAWVRYLRKQHKDGHLEQWKVDSLSALGFEWELTDQQAKWHHLYHQLRRYRVMYGTTDLDITRSSQDGCDWRLVAWWLRKQARLLAKQKLSAQQRAMLQQLGVCLTVPKRIVQRTAQLQALNGPERRKLRKKWKLQDNEQHEAARKQRQQELQTLLTQRRQQRETEQRRLRFMQQAVLGAAQKGAGPPLGSSSRTVQASVGYQAGVQAELVSIAVQQLQMVHQLSMQPQQETQQQPQHPAGAQHAAPASAAARQHLLPQEALVQAADLPGCADFVDSAMHQQTQPQQPSQQQVQRQPGHLHQPPVQPARQPQQQQLEPQQQQLEPQQQQVRQMPGVEAGALLFQPNRRRKKVGRRSRQERWLAEADS